MAEGFGAGQHINSQTPVIASTTIFYYRYCDKELVFLFKFYMTNSSIIRSLEHAVKERSLAQSSLSQKNCKDMFLVV